uniref:Uncharacterized protein n=1 Tax=Mola mola TaxID=94237 RepID=A0A3Q3XN22_MOLML
MLSNHIILFPYFSISLYALSHSDHSKDIETYHVSVGHLLVLKCHTADGHTNVIWSREGGHNQSLPGGLEVRDGLLLFLPVQMSHNGPYTCEKGDKTKSKMTFKVRVSSEKCPDPPETISIPQGVNGGLPCKQKEIFKLNSTRNIRWMKDCHLVERQVNDNGFIRLSAASENDAGKYTCLVDISLDGREYTAARSIQLTIKNGTYILWMAEVVHKRGRVYRVSTLSISKVLRQFLNVPFRCHVLSPADEKTGEVWLKEGILFFSYTALCLAASLIFLALVAVFLLFKVDLLLAYRSLLRHFTAQQAPSGKLYDAYVSFLHSDIGSAEVVSFALQVLPEVLERQHGYSLYIRGRDDCPGEAVHNVIDTTVRQCCRLIIILSPMAKVPTCRNKEEERISDEQNQLCYEQKIGLYEALTHNNPKVILVEIGPVDYSCLPESLRYIKRKQGSLMWRRPSIGKHRLTKLYLNRNFWKNLRFHMPSVPTRMSRNVIPADGSQTKMF